MNAFLSSRMSCPRKRKGESLESSSLHENEGKNKENQGWAFMIIRWLFYWLFFDMQSSSNFLSKFCEGISPASHGTLLSFLNPWLKQKHNLSFVFSLKSSYNTQVMDSTSKLYYSTTTMRYSLQPKLYMANNRKWSVCMLNLLRGHWTTKRTMNTIIN